MLSLKDGILSTFKNQQLSLIYDYITIIYFYNNCNYVFLLNQDFTINTTFLKVGVIQIQPKKVNKLLFTNNKSIFSIALEPSQPNIFNTITEYKQYLQKISLGLNIIYIEPYDMFANIGNLSRSEFINVDILTTWIMSNKYSFKIFEIEPYAKIYNFFNYVLIKLSERGFRMKQQTSIQQFHTNNINQQLYIDFTENRPITKCGVNYLNLKKDDQRRKKLKSRQKRFLLQVDYVSSYIQLLHHLLQIQLPQGDVYQHLRMQLKLSNDMTRQNVKQQVFKILFSNNIKSHINVPFFNTMYQFSRYLLQQYKGAGYINALLSGKKIYANANDANLRSKIFNMFIMNLQFELYMGVLYQLLLFDLEILTPIIYIYDSFVLQIDIDVYLQNLVKIESILTMNGKLKIKRKLGKNLYSLQDI